MKDRDLVVYITIKGYSEKYEMTALFSPKKEKYIMPSLTFYDESKKEIDSWDSSEYIFDTFYPMLKRWQDRMLSIEDIEEFNDILGSYEEDLLELIDIIEQAIDLGWNKL